MAKGPAQSEMVASIHQRKPRHMTTATAWRAVLLSPTHRTTKASKRYHCPHHMHRLITMLILIKKKRNIHILYFLGSLSFNATPNASISTREIWTNCSKILHWYVQLNEVQIPAQLFTSLPSIQATFTILPI